MNDTERYYVSRFWLSTLTLEARMKPQHKEGGCPLHAVSLFWSQSQAQPVTHNSSSCASASWHSSYALCQKNPNGCSTILCSPHFPFGDQNIMGVFVICFIEIQIQHRCSASPLNQPHGTIFCQRILDLFVMICLLYIYVG